MNLDDAKILTLDLMSKYKLDEWTFSFNRKKISIGNCNFNKKTIYLSMPFVLLNEELQVKNVILHEIAHALLPRNVGHSQQWKRKAIEIGCDGQRVAKNIIRVEGKIKYKCSNCKQIISTHRKLRRISACNSCCNKYNHGLFSNDFLLKEVIQ